MYCFGRPFSQSIQIIQTFDCSNITLCDVIKGCECCCDRSENIIMKSNDTIFGISEENFEISMIGILFVFVITFSCILEFCYFLRDCYYSNPSERDSLAEIETVPMQETQSELLRHLSNETQSLEFLQVINLKNHNYKKRKSKNRFLLFSIL